MGKEWTRRQFLGTSLAAPLVTGTAVSTLSAALVQLGPAKEPAAPGLSRRERGLLRAAMDEIIPAEEGMPAASEVGGVRYLERLVAEVPSLSQRLKDGLQVLGTASRNHFEKSFDRLSHRQRAEILSRVETEAAPEFFAALRDSVYEAYYTQPAVWKRLGFEFYPPDRPGPLPPPFDESVVARVRRLPKLYREVR